MATKNGLSQRLQDVKAKRLIRIFISSTFRDMIEDRNELMSKCWPQIRDLCRIRQVELSEIDLRWGISEAQSQRQETLKLCLDEIQKCRPFFLGLLGERYGWVPDSSALTQDLLQEQSWLRGIADTSVTELEILHGVLRDPGMSDRTFFYFRDPDYAIGRGGDFLSETKELEDKQTDLKKRIRQTCAAKGIFLHETYCDPKELAQLVLEQFTQVIDDLFPENEIPDPLDKEATEHEAFAASRRLTYIGRDVYYAALDSHASGAGKPLILTGASGGGKSALLANWVQHWHKDHPEDFIFQHYIGGTADSSNHWKLLRRLLSEIKRQTGDESEIPRDNDELRRDLQLWLSKARLWAEKNGKRFIIILDALNQLEDTDNAHLLSWVPDEPFRGSLRLIVSSLEGTCLESLKSRNWNYLPVNPLQPEEKGKLIDQYLQRFGKELDDTNTLLIVSAPQSENPLYLKILLDELRVTGTFEGLSQRIAQYMKAEDIPQLLREVLLRWQGDYERDRPGLVKDALSFILAARRGLSESELLEMLRPADLPKLPTAIWSPLRAALDESLVERAGILNFAHDYLRQAVQDLFLPDEDTQDDIRLQLADFIEAQAPSPRSCDELPWLLFTARSFERLQHCLLDIERFLLIYKRDKDELRRYWVDTKAQGIMGSQYPPAFAAWETATNPPDHLISYAASQLAYFLNEMSLHTAADPLMKRALAIDETIYGSEHPKVAISLNNLAQLLEATNRLAEAEPLMRRALTIIETSYGPEHPCVAGYINNLARLLQVTNRLAEAEPMFRRALKINEASYGPNHIMVAKALNNLAEQLRATNSLAEAEPMYLRALAIDESSYGPEHPEVAIGINNLAELFRTTNRPAEAEPLIRRALAIDEASYGPQHPEVGAVLNNLAQLLQDTNRLTEAEPLMLRALSISEASYGPEHPNVATALNNLALLIQETNRTTEAELLIRRALAIDATSYGLVHPNVARDLNNLAELMRTTNRIAEAEPLIRRAIRITEVSYGREHPTLASYINNLAGLLQATKRFGEAESLYRRAIKIDEASYGPEHPDVAIDLNNLARLLQETNHFTEAELLYRRAIKMYEDTYGSEHNNLGTFINNLAELLQATNRPAEAEPFYRRVLAIDEASYGPEHPNVAISLNNLARLLMILNRPTEAETIYHRSLKIDEVHYGPEHPKVATHLNNLASLLYSANRLAEAEPLARRVVKILMQITRNSGNQHPNLIRSINNYDNLLVQMGLTQEQATARIKELAPELFK